MTAISDRSGAAVWRGTLQPFIFCFTFPPFSFPFQDWDIPWIISVSKLALSLWTMCRSPFKGGRDPDNYLWLFPNCAFGRITHSHAWDPPGRISVWKIVSPYPFRFKNICHSSEGKSEKLFSQSLEVAQSQPHQQWSLVILVQCCCGHWIEWICWLSFLKIAFLCIGH